MTADDQAAGTDLAEAEQTIRADHYPVCRWPHDPMEMPGGCVGQCVMDCAAEGEEWPCSTARLLAEYERRGAELDRLAVRAQQHANSTSWAAREAVGHMQKADDLAHERDVLSSLLRGMARRVGVLRGNGRHITAIVDGMQRRLDTALIERDELQTQLSELDKLRRNHDALADAYVATREALDHTRARVAAVRALADDLDREADEAMRDQNTAHAAEIHELVTIANEFPKIAARIRAAVHGPAEAAEPAPHRVLVHGENDRSEWVECDGDECAVCGGLPFEVSRNPEEDCTCPTAEAAEPTREPIADLIERSSLGTPEAKAARARVSDEKVAQIMARVKQLDEERADSDTPREDDADELLIVRKPGRMSGRPTIGHSRLPLTTILEFLRGGDSVELVTNAYPSVTAEQVRVVAALRDDLDDRADEHVVTKHWDAYGGDVVERSCSCGERWTRDEERCPEDDRPTYERMSEAPGLLDDIADDIKARHSFSATILREIGHDIAVQLAARDRAGSVTTTPDPAALARLLRAVAAGRRDLISKTEHRPADDLLDHEAAAFDVAAALVEGVFHHLFDWVPSWRWTESMVHRSQLGTSNTTAWADVAALAGNTTETEEATP